MAGQAASGQAVRGGHCSAYCHWLPPAAGAALHAFGWPMLQGSGAAVLCLACVRQDGPHLVDAPVCFNSRAVWLCSQKRQAELQRFEKMKEQQAEQAVWVAQVRDVCGTGSGLVSNGGWR